MKQLFCLLFCILVQGALGTSPTVGAKLREKVELVAKTLNLLLESPSKAAPAADSSFCGLPWNSEKVFIKNGAAQRFGHNVPSLHDVDGAAWPEDKVKGKMLVVPEQTAALWSFCYSAIPFHGRLFVLKAGVCRWGNKTLAFTFDWKGMKARELKSEGQGEELVEFISKVFHHVNGVRGLGIKLLTLEAVLTQELGNPLKEQKEQSDATWSEFQRLDTEVMSRRAALEEKKSSRNREELEQGVWEEEEQQIMLLERQKKKMWEQHREQEEDYGSKMNSFSFKMLIYEDLGPIEKAADLVNIPQLEQNMPPATRAMEHIMRQIIALVRLVQMIKYLGDMPPEEGGLKGLLVGDNLSTFENEDVQTISDMIDRFNEDMSSEDQRLLAQDLLRIGSEFLEKSKVLSYYDALVLWDAYVRNLFFSPNREANQPYIFTPSSNFYQLNFEDSAWGPLLAYQVKREHFPLTLTVRVQNSDNLYELRAFMDDEGVLYMFKRRDDGIVLVSKYGSNTEDVSENVHIGDRAKLDILLQGTGTAIYRHRPSRFKRTKGINPAI